MSRTNVTNRTRRYPKQMSKKVIVFAVVAVIVLHRGHSCSVSSFLVFDRLHLLRCHCCTSHCHCSYRFRLVVGASSYFCRSCPCPCLWMPKIETRLHLQYQV